MKRIISILMAAALIMTCFAALSTLAGATTYISDGDWLLVIKSDTTYLVGGYNGTDTEITMPETVNGKAVIGVAEDFYEKCSSEITSVTLPDSYTVIQSFAFYGCGTLTSVNFPASLTALGSFAFNGCSSLADVDLSPAVNLGSVPYSCFSGCSSLGLVVLPDTVTSIGAYCFSGCSSLASVALTANLTSIGEYAFNECGSLDDIELPLGLTTIGEYAFYNDNALTEVYVPVSVSSIGANAFYPMAVDGGPLTIDFYADTYAANYAYQNYLNYTSVPLVKGDANNDGETNIRDVTYIQLYRVGLYDIDTDAKTIDRVDVTGDYEVTIRDATQIQMYRVGLVDSL